jgi:lysyl-tRNA synthetase class 2
VRKQVRPRFCQGVHQHGLASQQFQRCLATSAKGKIVKPNASSKEDGLEIRSHAVAARIEELSQANALDYPRIQNSDLVSMRIPTFREKYRDISARNPGQEEVVLHGR